MGRTWTLDITMVSTTMPHCQCCIYFESDIKDHYISIIVSTLNDISTDVSNRFGNTRRRPPRRRDFDRCLARYCTCTLYSITLETRFYIVVERIPSRNGWCGSTHLQLLEIPDLILKWSGLVVGLAEQPYYCLYECKA